MAAAVHHHLHLLLRPPPRQPGLLFTPRYVPPAWFRSSLRSPTCHLAAVAPLEAGQREDRDEFVVVTFYKLVPVEDPRADVAAHLHFLQGRDIHGRIYLNEQGINAQYSGPRKDATAYADWLKEDHRFSDILVQVSPALSGHAFPRLRLRYKQSLVQTMSGTLGILKELRGLTWTASEALPLGYQSRRLIQQILYMG